MMVFYAYRTVILNHAFFETVTFLTFLKHLKSVLSIDEHTKPSDQIPHI